jgi:hypothetical protein
MFFNDQQIHDEKLILKYRDSSDIFSAFEICYFMRIWVQKVLLPQY